MTELKTTDILLSSCLPRDLLETLNGSSFYKNSLPCLCLQQSAVSPLGTSIHLLTVYLSLSTPHGIANKQRYFDEAQSSDMNLVFQLSSISFLSQSCIPDCHLNCLHFCCFVFFQEKISSKILFGSFVLQYLCYILLLCLMCLSFLYYLHLHSESH